MPQRRGGEFGESMSPSILWPMYCPSCRADDTKVIDSRVADEGDAIRRRRLCPQCSYRFTTYERLEELPLTVVKTHGGREPFDRAKVMAGVQAGVQGSSGHAGAARGARRVGGRRGAPARAPKCRAAIVGLAVLDRLRELDEVAYLRFASVYKNFDAAGDFVEELQLLQKLQTPQR